MLYEDEEILIIDKPCGLPAQPGEGVRTSVISAVERDFGFVPYPVHRLDKETAGCMILAKSAAAASRWSALVEGRAIGKRYRALCSSGPRESRGRYSDPLGSPKGAVAAETFYLVLSRFGRAESAPDDEMPPFSYIEFELGTGRLHQIRRHSAMHGHPILGDDKYGDFALNRALAKSAGLKHLLLWAYRLDLPGTVPRAPERRTVLASLPPHFAAFFSRYPDAPNPEVI